MGKILVVFLCFFIVVAFGASIQNPESNSPGEISNEFLTKMRELEEFREEFKEIKSSFVELGAAFGRFHQSLTKNGTGEIEQVSTTTASTPQQTENPALQLASCSDAMKQLSPPRSQKQSIYPHGNSMSLEVLCDFETDGGGWTIIQKRSSGPQQDFGRRWTEYQNGFGSLDGNFWMGLDNIRALTQNGDQELRIQLEDFSGEKKSAKYSSFSVSEASDFYRLNIGGFSWDSTLQDDMAYHNRSRFSTMDKDNDNNSRARCAVDHDGGWWFKDCRNSNLNGAYFEREEDAPWQEGILWYSWRKGYSYFIAKSEMKIRKKKPVIKIETFHETVHVCDHSDSLC